MSPSVRELVFNGVNATTGRPLVPAMRPVDVVRLACGERRDPQHLADLQERHRLITSDHLEVAYGIDSRRLAETGWGVVFPHGASEERKQALAPLLAHRQSEATQVQPHFYRELTYRPGESKAKFLARHRVGTGPVDPLRLPYYLLLVGSPEEIPFFFQYQLDVQYAVGRIDFRTPEDYVAYAESVVAAETRSQRRARRMALFGVANDDDPTMANCLRHLAEPLAAQLAANHGRPGRGEIPWEFAPILGDAAVKARLVELLAGDAAPALVLTASHGVGFDAEDPRQRRHQGALLCQDWPGPLSWQGRIPADFYVSADDIGADADVSGLVTFHYACFGAGTPRFDEFAPLDSARRSIAPESFVAQLPQRLLAHPGGGALAVVGHVDRAWGYSYDWPQAPQQLGVFTSTFGRLFAGYPIGAAMDFFNQRYAELATDLSVEIENVRHGLEPDFLTLPGLWTATNDARSYVVLGDPAVRLAV